MKKLAVFLSSMDNDNPLFLNLINELAKLLVKEKVTLVYGGSTAGLMGKLADTTLAEGGKVIGVFVSSNRADDLPHPGLTEMIEVNSFAERIAVMEQTADGFMVLPGGLGTLEELFIIWNQIRSGLVNKPLGILNIGQFYSQLQDFLFQDMLREQFITDKWLKIPLIADDLEALFKSIKSII